MGRTTAILPCTCDNKWQDKHYGKGMRLHNALQAAQGGLTGKWRCTVCSTVRNGPQEE